MISIRWTSGSQAETGHAVECLKSSLCEKQIKQRSNQHQPAVLPRFCSKMFWIVARKVPNDKMTCSSKEEQHKSLGRKMTATISTHNNLTSLINFQFQSWSFFLKLFIYLVATTTIRLSDCCCRTLITILMRSFSWPLETQFWFHGDKVAQWSKRERLGGFRHVKKKNRSRSDNIGYGTKAWINYHIHIMKLIGFMEIVAV